MQDSSNTTNHLKNQSSPYLLQHASNPVDWFPWGKEAFQKAKLEDKMVFLSIGYSTCHWCHVMAHESFEDNEVANILNSEYVSIKVDREERPDIDEVYMNICQALTGSGGWPLTVIMTADKKPFFTGTYFPKHTLGTRIGLVELLFQISILWKNNRQGLLDQSTKIIEQIKKAKIYTSQEISNTKIIDDGYNYLKTTFDTKYGGFNDQPKFPSPHQLFFLLRYYKYSNDANALNMIETTLKSMYEGGIFDHVGYGFSRYSTDNKWLVPHFEKMLYDNALLIIAYCETYAATKNEIYRDVVSKIIEYIIRDMKSDQGAFYSAQDADSEGSEGKYYVFEYNELEKMFDGNEMEFLKSNYNITKDGNFDGKNILNKISVLKDISKLDSTIIKRLYDYRKKRVPPFLDTKILSSWNGFMIAALSTAGRVLDNKYVEYAIKAEEFIFSQMVDSEYKLYTSYKDLKLSCTGFLPDYANMTWGSIELYETTLDIKYLEHAIKLTQNMIRLFWDEKEMKFFMNEKNDSELPIRPIDEYDGAMPSGNSVAISNIIRLYNFTHDDDLKEIIDNVTKTFAQIAGKAPGAYLHYLSSLLLYTQPHRQVVLTGKNQKNLYHTINKEFMPFTTTIWYKGDKRQKDIIPDLANYILGDDLKAYVCENFICKNPISSEQELIDILFV